MWIDDEKNIGELTIRAFDKTKFYGNIPTNLKYCSEIQYEATEDRINRLIEYIKKHLEVSNQIEIWTVILGNDEDETPPKKRYVDIKNLKSNDFKISQRYSCECLVITLS